MRRVRRFIRRRFGKGKGKGRGKGSSFNATAYLTAMTDDDVEEVLFKGKGKGKSKGKRTSGKGFGRKGNPKGRDGQVMKCHECDSEEHLVAQCPRRKGQGKGLFTHAYNDQQLLQPQQAWHVSSDQEASPLGDIVENVQIFMVNPADPPNHDNKNPIVSSGSSQWTIPTVASHNIPASESMAQPAGPEREESEEGHRSQGSNVWSEHFQELQQPSFIHPHSFNKNKHNNSLLLPNLS